jgi:hypothetical protein
MDEPDEGSRSPAQEGQGRASALLQPSPGAQAEEIRRRSGADPLADCRCVDGRAASPGVAWRWAHWSKGRPPGQCQSAPASSGHDCFAVREAVKITVSSYIEVFTQFFIEFLISKNKTDITLDYNTNLSILSYKKYELETLWKQFKQVNLWVSCDGYKNSGEYIRKELKLTAVNAHKKMQWIDLMWGLRVLKPKQELDE